MTPRRTERGARLLPLVILLAACGAATPSAPAQATPGSPGAPTAAEQRSLAPTAAPTMALARLPMGRIVFDRMDGNPEGAFLGSSTLGSDGSIIPLTLPVSTLGFNGIWSPDGTRLLINSFDGERGTIATLDPTTNAYVVIEPKGMAGELECTDWTSDGGSVICSRGGPDPADDGIYTVDIATGKTSRLTTSEFHHATGTAGECGGGEGRAVYSPHSDLFAFVQQRCGTGPNPSSDEMGSLAVAEADGSNVRIIVPFGGVRTHPGGEIAWSPTDNVIAFGTQDGRLQTVRADGTELRTIELGYLNFAYGPTWSPDGKWLLVTIDQPSRKDLYLVNVVDGSFAPVTDGAAVETFSDWGVDP